MKSVLSVTLLTLLLASACNPSGNETNEKPETSSSTKKKTKKGASTGHWKGTFSNGMKGATISFDVESDELKNLTFQGYWRCEGKLDLTTLGPEGSFTIEGNKVDGVITEPENEPAPFRFELHGTFTDDQAEGTLMITNAAAQCTTYKLNWTAEKE